jgi:hypothetical protein
MAETFDADIREALESVRTVIVFSPRDMDACGDDAWIYGIIVGWGDVLPEVAAKHKWADQDVARLRRMRAAVEAAALDLASVGHQPKPNPRHVGQLGAAIGTHRLRDHVENHWARDDGQRVALERHGHQLASFDSSTVFCHQHRPQSAGGAEQLGPNMFMPAATDAWRPERTLRRFQRVHFASAPRP